MAAFKLLAVLLLLGLVASIESTDNFLETVDDEQELEAVLQLVEERGQQLMRQEMRLTKQKVETSRIRQRLELLPTVYGDSRNNSIGRMPESCPDLWRIGHSLAGFYPVKAGSKLLMTYCDLSDFIAEDVGNVDVKLQSVHFFVSRPGEYRNGNNAVVITYPSRITDHPAMDEKTFRVPVTGTYLFHFHCHTNTYSLGVNKEDEQTRVTLLINSEESTFNFHDSYYSVQNAMSWTAVVHLELGDRVETRFEYGIIRDSYFGGSLLESDVMF